MLQTLLDQIESTVSRGDYLAALMASLSIPDICGALESLNGEASRNQYIDWFNYWVSPKYANGLITSISGETAYYYRCSILHQARSTHPKLGYERIIFVEPGFGPIFHNNVLGDALNIDVSIFCRDIIAGAELWIDERAPLAQIQSNLRQSIQRHPSGLRPYIMGLPVIA